MSNQRKSYIINPKFQYKFSFIVCSLVLISTFIYPVTIYELYDLIISLNPTGAAEHENHRSSLIQHLVIMQIPFTGLVFLLCLFLSHKIAGPLYKLTMFLQDIRHTGEIRNLKFRDGDNFIELADEVNKTMDFISSKAEAEVKGLRDLSDYLENLELVIPEDKKPVLSQAREEISKILTYSDCLLYTSPSPRD